MMFGKQRVFAMNNTSDERSKCVEAEGKLAVDGLSTAPVLSFSLQWSLANMLPANTLLTSE